ncbi:MAG: AAA family ATPase [Hyphomonadaceae bacterium]|nr:AAA family ATPase [Clostridia bacterium]
MRIKSIRIKNYKGIKEEKFEFNDDFTLLIGDNSTGKTTILEAITIAMGAYVYGCKIPSKGIIKDEVRTETTIVGDASLIRNMKFPVEIECEAVIDNIDFNWHIDIVGERSNMSRKGAKKLIDYVQRKIYEPISNNHKQDITLPIITYQSAGRMWTQKREKWEDPFKSSFSRFAGYIDCLEAESNMKMFVSWFKRMTFIELQNMKNLQPKEIGEFNAVKRAVINFLSGLVGIEKVDIFYDITNEDLMVKISDEVIPLRLLSTGYRCAIGMVTDIAYRMAVLNPHLKENAASETNGIILIDELDLHLHPKWQWRIVEDIKHTFPKAQFIVTTHAPIVIASCNDDEIIRLYEQDGEILHSTEPTPNGWLVEDILIEKMDTSNRSKRAQEEIERLEWLYTKKIKTILTEEEKSEYNALIELYRNLPEGDPAVIVAKLNAIGNKVFGEKDNA